MNKMVRRVKRDFGGKYCIDRKIIIAINEEYNPYPIKDFLYTKGIPFAKRFILNNRKIKVYWIMPIKKIDTKFTIGVLENSNVKPVLTNKDEKAKEIKLIPNDTTKTKKEFRVFVRVLIFKKR